MNIYDLNNLYDLLDKLIQDKSAKYYAEKGYSPYRDGLILLRTSFHEPFIKNQYKYHHHKAYLTYFENHVRKNKYQSPPTLEGLIVWEKLVVLTHQGIRPSADHSIDKKRGIFKVHSILNNEGVHKNEIVTQKRYAYCYWHIQEFACEILDINEDPLRFKSIEEVINCINKGVSSKSNSNEYSDPSKEKIQENVKLTEPFPHKAQKPFLWKYFIMLISVGLLLAVTYYIGSRQNVVSKNNKFIETKDKNNRLRFLDTIPDKDSKSPIVTEEQSLTPSEPKGNHKPVRSANVSEINNQLSETTTSPPRKIKTKEMETVKIEGDQINFNGNSKVNNFIKGTQNNYYSAEDSAKKD